MGDDWKSIAIALLGIVCTLLGWWGNVVWNAVKDLRAEHSEAVRDLRESHSALELHLSDRYVKKDDLKERLQEVMQPFKDTLDEIKSWMRSQQK